MPQLTNSILLIRPKNFFFNIETSLSNSFQSKMAIGNDTMKKKVQDEFENATQKLRSQWIDVHIFDDTDTPIKPDAIFPNNWVTFHSDGSIFLYPMFAENRRNERRMDIIESLKKDFTVTSVEDLSYFEQKWLYLEGTWSMIFDHENKISYACISPRTSKVVLDTFCEKVWYQAVSFTSVDENMQEIYHTNVMMMIGDCFSIICLESIRDQKERNNIVEHLESTWHEIIDISLKQVRSFVGNMLHLSTKDGGTILVLSANAYQSLTKDQEKTIEKYAKFTPLDISTIESIGWWSVRCMIAEIFLPRKY